MQTILYHNQSGSAAFTGELKQREVHRAITMHPVKEPSHMYRLHSYVKVRKCTSIYFIIYYIEFIKLLTITRAQGILWLCIFSLYV